MRASGNGAGSRSRTGTPLLAVDFESTTSTNSIIPAHYIFDENPRKQPLENGGPFRRSIGNSEKTKCEKVQENQGFASLRAGVDESDFESTTSTNSIIPADVDIIIQCSQKGKLFFKKRRSFYTSDRFEVGSKDLCISNRQRRTVRNRYVAPRIRTQQPAVGASKRCSAPSSAWDKHCLSGFAPQTIARRRSKRLPLSVGFPILATGLDLPVGKLHSLRMPDTDPVFVSPGEKPSQSASDEYSGRRRTISGTHSACGIFCPNVHKFPEIQRNLRGL